MAGSAGVVPDQSEAAVDLLGLRLAAYTSPESGRNFVLVTQASGNQIAQLELTSDRRGRVTASEVRRLEAPVDGSELLYNSDDDRLVPDIEGLDLYLGAGTSGYIIASSQGDSTFHVWERDGDREYLGRFAIGAIDGIDATDESDGFDVVSAPIGRAFPDGLLAAHDGQDELRFPNVDEDELENAATNFVYVSWADIADATGLAVDTSRSVRG